MNSTTACEILSTIVNAKKKRFQLVDFEASEYGLMVAYRSSLKDPSKAGGYFREFGLEVAPTMLEDNGVFTIWLRKAREA